MERNAVALTPFKYSTMESDIMMKVNNNEKFNQALNSLNNPRRVMEALRLFAKPCVEQAHDVDKEVEVCIGQNFTLADIP